MVALETNIYVGHNRWCRPAIAKVRYDIGLALAIADIRYGGSKRNRHGRGLS